MLLKQDILHHFLEHRRRVLEAHRHHGPLDSATRCAHRLQMPILFSKRHLMKAMAQIQHSEEFAFGPFGDLLLDQGKGMRDRHCGGI